MIKKFVETKRVKEIIVKSRLGKQIRSLTTLGIAAGFFLWSGLKKLLKVLGIKCITVYYGEVSDYKTISTLTIEPVRYPETLDSSASPQNDNFPIPEEVSSFTKQKHYPYIVASIPNGRLLGQNTIATQANTIIRNLTRRPNKGYAGNPWSYMFQPKDIIKKPGTAIVLTGNDTFQNLNHRVTFGLAKYYLYEKAGVKPDWYILDNHKAFHQEAREKLGIPKEKMIVPQAGQAYEFDTLVAANTTTIYGIIPPRMSQFIKSLFWGSDLPKPTKKLYLKRTGTRRVLNEKEFDAYLTEQGYEIITTSPNKAESLDYELFASASHIISPHGAGLTKIIFSQPGTKVIELFQPQTLFGHYYTMSKSLGLDYHCFVGKKDPEYEGLDMDAGIIIDVGRFDEWMRGNGLIYPNNF